MRPLRQVTRGLVALFAVLACSLSAAGASGGSSAEPIWLPPVTLSQHSVSRTPEFALNARGDAIVVWDRFDGSRFIVLASFRPAGAGRWPAPVEIASSMAETSPHVAIDPSGNAVVVWTWTGSEIGQRWTEATYRGRSGRWRPHVRISAPDLGVDQVQVGADAAGNFVAAWYVYAGSYAGSLQAAYRPASSGAWKASVNVSSEGGGYSLAVAPDGTAVLAWVRNGIDPRPAISAAVGLRGAWRAPELLARSFAFAGDMRPVAAAGRDGRALVAWTHVEGGNYVIRASLRPDSSLGWQAPEALSFSDGQAYKPALGFDARGNALAVWAAKVDVEASYLAIDRQWERPVAVSGPLDDRFGWLAPAVVMSASGRAVAVWLSVRFDPATSEVESAAVEGAAFQVNRGWLPVATLGEGDIRRGLPRVSVDGSGNALAVWPTERSVLAAALDSSGPVLRSLRIPTTGKVGATLHFSVSPVDVWSKVAGTRWNFGGASTTTGTSVARVYRRPGRHSVTVTSVDALGNETSTTRSVEVKAKARE